MAFACLVDLRSEELKRQIGDLLVFLLVFVRIRARWSESEPMLSVVKLWVGYSAGEAKM